MSDANIIEQRMRVEEYREIDPISKYDGYKDNNCLRIAR